MARLSLAQLETFIAVCHAGSFTGAAAEQGLTQPAVSARIHDLEQSLGVTLFDRRASPVRLTSAGMLARQYAGAGLETLEVLYDRMHNFGPLDGYLRVGSSSTFATACLPQLLRAVNEEWPQLHLELMVADSRELSPMMSRGQLDIAFLGNWARPARAHVAPLGQIPVRWVAAAGTDLPPSVVMPTDVAGRRIVVNPPPSNLHAALRSWFRDAGVYSSVVDTCNNLPTTCELVRIGAAVSILPIWVIPEDARRGDVIVRPARPEFAPIDLCVAYMPGAPTRATHALIALARRVIASARDSAERLTQ